MSCCCLLTCFHFDAAGLKSKSEVWEELASREPGQARRRRGSLRQYFSSPGVCYISYYQKIIKIKRKLQCLLGFRKKVYCNIFHTQKYFPGQRDKNVSQKKDCSLCGSGKHPPFKCGKIQEIQAKKMDKPENLCERCCHWFKQGDPHQGACHIKSYLDKNGITKKMNLLCSIHQSTHYALCGACAPGQTTSGPKTSTPVVPGARVSPPRID